jgi:hypothetical protein
MSRIGPQRKPDLTCWDCGAASRAGAPECWLCHRRDWRRKEPTVPAETGATPGGPGSRLSIAGVIAVGAILIVGAGMVLDIWKNASLWMFLLFLILTLLGPVILIFWTRAQKQPFRGQPMTQLEFATAGTTIAAGVILLAWLTLAGGGSFAFGVFGALAAPAALITWVRARNRDIEGRPMTGLQVTASVMFLAVLLPALLVTSLGVALFFVCLATGPPRFH